MRARLVATVMMGLVGVAVPIAVDGQEAPTEPRCSRDAQCEVSSFAGCCSVCLNEPKGWLTTALQKRMRQCAVIDCTMAPGADARCKKPRPVTDFVARCVAGTCRAVLKSR